MASIYTIASEFIHDLEMASILLWKNGRSWNYEILWPEEMSEVEYDVVYHEDDRATISRVIREDRRAVLLNSYFENLGSLEHKSIANLARFLVFDGRLLLAGLPRGYCCLGLRELALRVLELHALVLSFLTALVRRERKVPSVREKAVVRPVG